MSIWRRQGITALILVAALLMNLLVLPVNRAAASDEYDGLRSKIYDVLTGGAFNPADPDIAPKIQTLNTDAQNFWSTLNKAVDRAYLWSDLSSPLGPDMTSNHVSGSYSRLSAMAAAYSTFGTTLYQNAALLADIISGMDWMYANRYTMSVPVRGYDNWYDWQISSPLSINRITTMLYSNLTATQISDWQAVISRQTLALAANNTGANRIWTCYIMITGGILTKDSSKITAGVNGISPVLDYVTSGEGYYKDGSFLQHTALIPYNGGYGVSLLDNLTQVMYIVAGSTWDIKDPDLSNVYQWIYDAYEPLFYRDSMPDMVNGRNIARIANDSAGQTSMGGLGSAVVRLAYAAPNPADAARYKSMVKQWMNEAGSATPYASLGSIQIIAQTKAIMNDPSIIARGDLVLNKQYANMARTVHRRPGFTFGISMSNKASANYESLNGENLKGWHTGDGMTYLYNGDTTQYQDAFWPTVDSHRMPGTTVLKNSEPAAQQKNNSSWVGGTEVGGLYGVTGMQVVAPDASLSAYKSWFMFDDEIVNLGAGIQSPNTGIPVETIVDNRKLNSGGNNTLTVNGSAKVAAMGTEETLSGTNWAHLAGNAAGADMGYYFPGGATLKGLRETRTATWYSINNYFKDKTANPEYYQNYTRSYLSLRFDHGAAPTNGTYSYVLLPNKTAAEVSKYAGSPDITVLENSVNAQAVRENNLQVTGINFWQNATKTVGSVTSNKKASVMLSTGENGIEVSVADPTKENTGTIEVSLAMSLGPVAYKDPAITVTTAGGTTKLTVNVNGAGGRSLKVYFSNPLDPVTGYAVNEDFNGMGSGSLDGKNGWTGDNGGVAGDTITVQPVNGASSEKFVKLSTKATGGKIDAYRLFNAPANSLLTSEVTVTADDNYWKNAMIMADSSLATNGSAVHIVIENGRIWGYNGGTKTDILASAVPGIPYRIKAVINTSTKKFDVYINDQLLASQWNYRYTGITRIDKFFSSNSQNLNSSMSIDDVKVSYAPLTLTTAVNENFNGMTTGNLNGQNGWVGDNGGVAANLIEVKNAGSGADKRVQISTKATGGKVDAYKLFTAPANTTLIAEVTAFADDTYWKNALIMADSSLTANGSAVHIVMENGKLWGYNGGMKTDLLTSIDSGVPYRIKAVINTATQKFDVYVNGQLRASQWSYRYSGLTKIDKFSVSNAQNLNSSMSFDDVKISYN